MKWTLVLLSVWLLSACTHKVQVENQRANYD